MASYPQGAKGQGIESQTFAVAYQEYIQYPVDYNYNNIKVCHCKKKIS